MDKIPDSVSNIINSYIAVLKNNRIPVSRVYLFGSYARGTAGQWSDIDIALISDAFTGNRIKDRDLIRKYTRSTSSLIEVIPFSSEDFNENNPLANEILKSGIRIM